MPKTPFGTEKETTELDDSGSTLTVIKKFRNYEVARTLKNFRIRERVANSQEEMAQYIKFTDTVAEKRQAGVLVVKDDDPTLLPAFCLEYPSKQLPGSDGFYFVVKSWTEYVS